MKLASVLFTGLLLVTGFAPPALALDSDRDICVRGEAEKTFLKNTKLITPEASEEKQFLAKEETTLPDGTKLNLFHVGCESYGLLFTYTLHSAESKNNTKQWYKKSADLLEKTLPLFKEKPFSDIIGMQASLLSLSRQKNPPALGSEIPLGEGMLHPQYTVTTQDENAVPTLTIAFYIPL